MERINHLVGEGITDFAEVSPLLVKELFLGRQLPDEFNRCFYPSRRDISQLVYRAKNKVMCGLSDIEALQAYLLTVSGEVLWEPPGPDGQELLLVYQSESQRQLLSPYGDHLCLLNATYRTVPYTLPFYQLVVRTNAEYMTVATFYVQRETMPTLKAALAVIKRWNPQTFLVDCDDREEAAVKELFPGKTIVLTWVDTRWLSTGFRLTHWGWMTHICVGNLSITSSDNGLSLDRCQAITWTIAGILLIEQTSVKFYLKFETSSLKKMHLKMSSGKCLFCLSLIV